MGFSVFPTNIGGVSINSITSPLASLLTPTNVQNLTYPSDLGSNPAMGHAVIIQAYDYTTNLANEVSSSVNQIATEFQATAQAIPNGVGATFDAISNINAGNIGTALGNIGTTVLNAPNYSPIQKSSPLTTISLFMPETLAVSYDSSYSDVSITEELGIYGLLGHAYADYKNGVLKDLKTPYEIGLATQAVGSLANKFLGTGENIGPLAAQAMGVVVNPQMQLLYRGVSLRTFQLEFILTPKSSAEAKVVKDICDSLAFYSLPGTAGAQTGTAGQYLTPPQIFSVQFKFLGQNGIIGNLQNVISSALTNSGLGFLTSGTANITGAPDAKVFKVNDCVLENVNVDYAPNGWAAYNDGYPVQTRLTLQFKETQMLTKNHFAGSEISINAANQEMSNFNTGPAMGGGNSSSIDLTSPAYGPDGE